MLVKSRSAVLIGHFRCRKHPRSELKSFPLIFLWETISTNSTTDHVFSTSRSCFNATERTDILFLPKCFVWFWPFINPVLLHYCRIEHRDLDRDPEGIRALRSFVFADAEWNFAFYRYLLPVMRTLPASRGYGQEWCYR